MDKQRTTVMTEPQQQRGQALNSFHFRVAKQQAKTLYLVHTVL